MYAYIKTDRGLWTVGYCGPDGKFIPESDYSEVSKEIAMGMVCFLNGTTTRE